MNAMLLAAGLGTRLRPLTDAVPKPLLPIAGKPLIVWNLLLLREQGIRDVVINLHHHGHLIERTLGDGRRWGMRVVYSREAQLLGTGGGVKQAEGQFDDDPILILNGDTLVDFELQHILTLHRDRKSLATMVVRDDPDPERWGVIETDAEERILAINGRGRQGTTPLHSDINLRPGRHSREGGNPELAPDPGSSPGQALIRGQARNDKQERTSGAKYRGTPVGRSMFAGVQLVNRSFLDVIPKATESSIIDAYVHCLEQDAPIYSSVTSGYWNDVGTPARYVQTQLDAEAGRISMIERLDH